TGVTPRYPMQGPAALSFHCAASSGAKRGRVRDHPLPHRLPPLSAVCAALGQDADDAARPPRPTRPSAYVARICDDAAGVNLKYAAYARPLGKLVRHGLPWVAVQSLCRRALRPPPTPLPPSHLSRETTRL